ncbi:threonine ammonia-lyase [Schumannella luteola]|uniref:L-threonine dehydratase catabolic TdcB n=1 Tax=Schumannella luteola TaxID=472059 RepID=A0A852YHQ5_9MICO|nr:threonine ammonia-lyase [Schumannella luteola]NYG99417.1 threonine dehydratase [Schumannella luteola]TPX06136.1 threonine ammonia-lyase [Schumannella luteola]
MSDSRAAVDPAAAVPLPGPTLVDIRAARERLAGVVETTPIQGSRFLDDLLGVKVRLKAENLQRTGSYKIRGAFNRLSQLSPEERDRGVVAASAGNHAQGVALAARELGIKATIFMPIGVALPKLQATRGYGADVVLHGHVVDETLAAAAEFAERTGAVIIPPFDHPDVVAGQGTLAYEILEQVPDVANVVVPIGGGGLIAGVATAFAQLEPEIGRRVRVIGVQAANAAAYPPSLSAGEPVTIITSPTIADGIHVARPGRLNFDLVQRTVDTVVTVDDDDTARALLVLLERAKLVVEPAGAVGVGAALSGALRGIEGTTVFLLSGGNIDPMVMERVIGRGLAASARYLKVRIPLPDRPGQLSTISALIAEANANVVEVLHTRHGLGLQISEVSIEIHMETRGQEHAEQVLQTLREAGYRPYVENA